MKTLSFLLLISLTGCSTLGTGISGKTSYEMTFSDIIPDQQNTQFSVKVKAPAGDLVEAVGNMDYQWDGGSVSVNQQTNIDSTAQADMLIQMQMINAQILSNLTSQLAPLVGPILENRTANKVIEAETKKAEAQITSEMFNKYMERWSAADEN